MFRPSSVPLAAAALLMISIRPAGAVPSTPLKDIVLPASTAQWSIEKGPDDKVDLKMEEGCLRVDFDTKVESLHQVGHQIFKQGGFEIRLQKPVALDSSAGRILFDTLNKTTTTSGEAIRVLPLIADQSGERLSYVPVAFPHLARNASKWNRVMTPYFFCGEAGGATQDIYEAEGGDRNAWPDGKLSFLGFKIEARLNDFGRKAGSFYVSGIQAGGMKLPFSEPYAYADSLFKDAGSYQVGVQVTNQYQGQPVRELVRKVEFDPASLKSRLQRVVMPLGPDDNYWIQYQIAKSNGVAVESKKMRFQVEGNPDTKALVPIDVKVAPPLRSLRINPIDHLTGVYEASEPLTVTVRVFAREQRDFKLKWDCQAMIYPAPISSGEQEVIIPAGQTFVDVPVTVKPIAGRDAYRLQVTLVGKGGTVDSANYTFGHRTDFSTPYRGRAGVLQDRDYVKKASYERITYTVLDRKTLKSEADALADFNKCMDEISRVTRYVTYMIDVRDFEVLPGVYDFSLLDKVMDAAVDKGCTLTIRLSHIDAEGENTWLKYSRQRSFDGLEIEEPYYGGFAVADDRYIDAWLRAYKALYNRYKEHPGFQGYYLMQPAGEATMEDKPWQGLIAGYEGPTQEAFRAYLRDTMKLSLEALNTRWGAKYKSWSEVLPPAPDFQSGKNPDLRLAWVDFCRFKMSLDNSGWFPKAAKAIREYDSKRVIITYGGTGDPDSISGLVDYMHNGGNHFLQLERELVDAWEEGGTGWITEPHHPHRWAAYGGSGYGWVLDWSIFVATAQAAGGGANLHVYYLAKPATLPEHYGGATAFDRFMRFKPILDELQTAKLTTPSPQIGLLQDPYTLFCKHRTTFGPRLEDLKRWFELVRADGLPKENFHAEKAGQYKLILPNILDEVMSAANVDAVSMAVREGGSKTIISAGTGKFCPERGQEPFQLLKSLGIKPPTGAYVQGEKGIQAEIAAENPVFKSGEKVSFYSLADLQGDLQSSEVRKGFWNWPYRWIPQTDYFGYYKDNRETNGQVLARFPSGGVALSLHKVGKGEVLVFWGTPDFRVEKLKGFMAKAAEWAGVENPGKGNEIPLMLEAKSQKLGRNYVMLYNDKPGSYVQRFPQVPDGNWYLDETVTDQKLGVYTGEELRTKGLKVDYLEGYSPLKIYRLIAANRTDADWVDKVRKKD